MNADDLKRLQAPLKSRYREDPKAAQITLRAQGRVSAAIDSVVCKIETGAAMVQAGLHPATGGDGLAACSGDMLLEALVACAGVTFKAVSTALGIPVHDARLTAEGDLDFRGTLGVDKEAPVGFSKIRLNIEVDGDVTPEQVATLTKLTERYCVVLQTLRQGPQIEVGVDRARTAAG